ncbi:hypothetical protein CerSpe_119920 [Prunus speciosa]
MSTSVADIEQCFGSFLVLTSCEQASLVIGSSNVADTFVSFIYGLLAQVLTDQHVNRNSFIKIFTQLWKGSADVSIKKIGFNRIWVYFVCDHNKKRVLDMEPWAFRRSLILLADIPNHGNMDSLPLTLGTFWVQLHHAPAFCMTVVIIAKAIGAIIREVL